MQDTFHERDIVAPKKNELLAGAACWVIYLVGMSLLLSRLLPLAGIDLDSERGACIYQIASYLLNFAVVLLVLRKFLWRSLEPLRKNGGRLLSTVLLGFLIYFALMYLVEILISYISLRFDLTRENRNNEVIIALLTRYPFVMAMCTIFFAPLTEECLVRGVIFAPVCKRKPWLAYLLTTVLFGALHVLPFLQEQEPAVLFLSFLQYLPAGIVLGWAYQRTRSIFGALALHSFINAFAVLEML